MRGDDAGYGRDCGGKNAAVAVVRASLGGVGGQVVWRGNGNE